MATTRSFFARSTRSSTEGSRPSRSFGCTPTEANTFACLCAIWRISGKVSSVTDAHSMCPTPLSRARWSTVSRPAFRGSKLRWQWESTSSVTLREYDLYDYLPKRRKERKEKLRRIKPGKSLRPLRLCGKRYYCFLHCMREAVGVECPGADAFDLVARGARILLAELEDRKSTRLNSSH